MPDTNSSSLSPNGSAGHLCLRVEGAHPQGVAFGFEQPRKRLSGAFGVSALTHGAACLLLLLAVRYTPAPSVVNDVLQRRFNKDVVWIADPGPGGGGGGGGNRMPDPPRKAELPGKDTIGVPIVKPEPLTLTTPDPKDQPKPEQRLEIAAKSLAADTTTLPGAIDGTSGGSLSQGSGSGGGAGTGAGTGDGSGRGPGLGDGSDGGFGGGARRPGNGVTTPVKVTEVKPRYTADAMRLRIQGSVFLECVVLPDGTVGPVQVIRSLDSVFGLDQEAIKAAKQWRFKPGTQAGQPVPVIVIIEVYFNLQ